MIDFSMIECQVDYAVDCIRRLIRSGRKSMSVKEASFLGYQSWLEGAMEKMVFGGGSSCASWYKNARGIVWTLWPGNCTKYWWRLRRCNMADFDLK